MRVVRVYGSSGAEGLKVELLPCPRPGPGQILVRVDATTVISSEVATREGVSTAHLPLTLGNEFVGTVALAPGGELAPGTRVAGGYGGYGYIRDGAWAEYVLVDSADAFPVDTALDDAMAAAIPASFTAASGSLKSLGDVRGRRLLIRGGTSGVGLAIATLAKSQGATIIATTRDPAKIDRLRAHGADEVVIDGTDFPERVRALVPGGVDLAVDLLGLATLSSTMGALREHGVACLTGLLEDQERSIRSGLREDRDQNCFPHVLEFIPPGVRLTTGGVVSTPRTPAMVQDWFSGVEAGRLQMPVDSIFPLEEIMAANRRRKHPDAFGKVVLTISAEATRAAREQHADRFNLASRPL